MGQLAGEENFPKMPSNEKSIIEEFNKWKKQVVLDKKTSDKLMELPLRYKYRLCIKHDQIVANKKYDSGTVDIKQKITTIRSTFEKNL
jgi:hypothetical protein